MAKQKGNCGFFEIVVVFFIHCYVKLTFSYFVVLSLLEINESENIMCFQLKKHSINI